MKKLIALSALTFASALLAADVAYSPPVGGFTTTAAANTDTLVSPTLAREAAWRGAIASGSSTSIAISSAAWTDGQFAPGSETYYIRMLSGSLAGQFFVITGNTASVLSVDAAGLNLSTINSGDNAEIVPFWTLGTLYPASQAGTAFIASASSFNRQTELLFFDAIASGINRSASSIYYFTNGAWRKVGQSAATSFNSTIIYPDTYFLHRNKATPTSLVYVGRVQPGAAGTVIEARAAQHDNYVAISFPVDVTLGQSGLKEAGFMTSASAFNRADQLLVFGANQTGINKSASTIYYYLNGGWRKVGQPVTSDFSSDTLPAGSGFIIRKAANSSGFAWAHNTGI